ncbi:MAG: TlpA family protein disulfide reductase [Gemmatimonadetes bacterium]|nr:TlpA family protein disulfide reductase [Gemmatimonadota bacterium]
MSKTPKKRATPKKGNGGNGRSTEDAATETRRSNGGNNGTSAGAKRRDGGKGRAGGWFRSVEVALWLMVVGAVLYRFVPGVGPQQVSEDGTAPNFTVHTLSGDKVTLSDLRGDVVLVNFWATWCPPCRLEIPGFQRVYDDYKDKGFTVVGLSTDEAGPGVVQRFVSEHSITYPIGMATNEMRRLYGGVDALPQSFLLDKTGHVRKMVAGMFSEGILRREVDALLTEGQGQ